MWLNAQPAYQCQSNYADFLERRLARIMHRSLVRPFVPLVFNSRERMRVAVGWFLEAAQCQTTIARFTTARTTTDGFSAATTIAASSSCTKLTCLPAERRLKSRLVTFSVEARRDPSIKRLSALSATSSIPTPRVVSIDGVYPISATSDARMI